MAFPKKLRLGIAEYSLWIFLVGSMELLDLIMVGIFGFDNVGFGQSWRFYFKKMGMFSIKIAPGNEKFKEFLKVKNSYKTTKSGNELMGNPRNKGKAGMANSRWGEGFGRFLWRTLWKWSCIHKIFGIHGCSGCQWKIGPSKNSRQAGSECALAWRGRREKSQD